jgi:hypothetical protein
MITLCPMQKTMKIIIRNMTFCKKITIPAATTLDCVRNRMSYILLSRLWCDIALNVRDTTRDTCDDWKDSLCNISEQVFNTFPECEKNILLRYFNAKLRWKDIFTLANGNKELHEYINDRGVKRCKLCHIQKSKRQEYNVLTLKDSWIPFDLSS